MMVFQAWVIMFTKGGSNVIRVGLDGGYWTMLTGGM